MKAGSPLVRKTHMRTWFDTQFQKVNRPLATRQRIPNLGGKDLWAGWVSTGPESPRFEGSSSPKTAAPRPIKRAPTVGLHRCHLTTLRVTVKLQSPVSLFRTPQSGPGSDPKGDETQGGIAQRLTGCTHCLGWNPFPSQRSGPLQAVWLQASANLSERQCLQLSHGIKRYYCSH